jgi:DNA-binding NtrC family response regulator
MPRAQIIFVHENPDLRAVMEEHLAAGGYKVRGCAAPPSADAGEFWDADCALISVPAIPGDRIAFVRELSRRLSVVLLTELAEGRPAEVAPLLAAGAVEFLRLPADGVTLLALVHRVLRLTVLESRLDRMRDTITRLTDTPGAMVGGSAAMEAVRRSILTVARFSAPVLITGETGSGKELVARALHEASGRAGEFVALNSASFGESLFEAELFGHEPGAFTGARGRKIGLVEVADGGTLFLDEIGELSAPLQARLLRFLDDGRFRRVGGIREIETDVRIVAATNRPIGGTHALTAERSDSFRSDLYFRLAAYTIEVPPLKSRSGDIPDLVEHFRAHFAERHRTISPGFSNSALALLSAIPWPGNVRELRNAVERLLLTYSGETIIDEERVRAVIARSAAAAPATQEVVSPVMPTEAGYHAGLALHIEAFERAYFSGLIERYHHNISAAAREAGLDRKTLAAKLKALRLGKHDPDSGD